MNDKLNEAFDGHKNVGEIRNIGLINAIELVNDRDTKEGFDSRLRVGYEIYKRALKKGLILRPLGNVLYFNPPLVITEDVIEKAVDICRESVREILG